MLYLLGIWILVIPVLIGWGNLCRSLIQLPKRISFDMLLGFFILSLVFQGIAFFGALNLFWEILILSIGFILFFSQKKYLYFYKFIKRNNFLTAILGVIILFMGSFSPFILDHFGYYIPSIFWLQEWGLVKGISNLNLTLGQMSLWHILQSGIGNFADSFFRLNSILLFTYCLYLIENKKHTGFLFLPFLFFFIQSPSPDLIVIISSLIIIEELHHSTRFVYPWILLSIWVFSIKPTAIFAPVFSILYAFFHHKIDKKYIIYSIIVLSFFIFKNIWTFGYPIFPISFLELPLQWLPHPEILQKSAEIAISKTYDMQYSYQEIKNFTFFEYITAWFSIKGIKSIIHIFFIILLLIFIIYSFILRRKKLYLILSAVMIKSIFILTFSAQYRFFLDLFFIIIFVFLLNRISKKNIFMLSILFSLGSIFILCFPQFLQKNLKSFSIGHFMVGFSQNQWLRPGNFELKKYQTHQIGNLKFHLPTNYPFDFDTPIPCLSMDYLKTYDKQNIFPQLIDSQDIKKGFVWKKLTPNQKEKLQKIIQFETKNQK